MYLDTAHLARMRARADAEFYTALKLAEANKVQLNRFSRKLRALHIFRKINYGRMDLSMNNLVTFYFVMIYFFIP